MKEEHGAHATGDQEIRARFDSEAWLRRVYTAIDAATGFNDIGVVLADAMATLQMVASASRINADVETVENSWFGVDQAFSQWLGRWSAQHPGFPHRALHEAEYLWFLWSISTLWSALPTTSSRTSLASTLTLGALLKVTALGPATLAAIPRELSEELATFALEKAPRPIELPIGAPDGSKIVHLARAHAGSSAAACSAVARTLTTSEGSHLRTAATEFDKQLFFYSSTQIFTPPRVPWSTFDDRYNLFSLVLEIHEGWKEATAPGQPGLWLYGPGDRTGHPIAACTDNPPLLVFAPATGAAPATDLHKFDAISAGVALARDWREVVNANNARLADAALRRVQLEVGVLELARIASDWGYSGRALLEAAANRVERASRQGVGTLFGVAGGVYTGDALGLSAEEALLLGTALGAFVSGLLAGPPNQTPPQG